MTNTSVELKVTHFYRRSPSDQGWIQTSFITRKTGEEKYYLGLTGKLFFEEKIKIDVKNGSLQELPSEHIIYKNQTVWIAPDQSVFIADALRPLSNPHHKVFKDRVSVSLSLIEAIIKILNTIKNEDLAAYKHELEYFITREYWEALITILLNAIKEGSMSIEQFREIGYLFYRAHYLDKERAQLLLNKYDSALNMEGLGFVDKDGNHQYWDGVIMDKKEFNLYMGNINDFVRPVVEF